jgi:hypothetical protein
MAARRRERRGRLDERRDRPFYQRTMWPAGRVLVDGGSAPHSPAGSAGSNSQSLRALRAPSTARALSVAVSLLYHCWHFHARFASAMTT